MAKSKILKGGEPVLGGQEHIEGMEPMPKNEKISRLARRTKSASLAASRSKSEHEGLKEQLIDAMTEAELEHYHYGDVTVHVDTSRKLKIEVTNEDKGE